MSSDELPANDDTTGESDAAGTEPATEAADAELESSESDTDADDVDGGDGVENDDPEDGLDDDSADDEDPDDEDTLDVDDDSLWSTDDEPAGYLEISRSGPGWAASRWIISAAVAAVVVVACFLIIPRLFTPDDPEPATQPTTAPPAETTSAAPATSEAPQLTYPEVVAQASPVHYWQFDLADAAADTAGGAPLTIGLEAAALGSSAYAGGAGAIDCSGTWGSRSPSSVAETPSGDFTIEAWINTVSNKGGPVVTFANPNTGMMPDRVLFLGADGRVTFGALDANWTPYIVTSVDAVNDGTWRHLVGTMSSSGGLSLYVDGQPVATEPNATSVNSAEGFWTICGDTPSGWPGDPGQPAFSGTVDDVSIYDKALTAEQVAQHHSAATA